MQNNEFLEERIAMRIAKATDALEKVSNLRHALLLQQKISPIVF